MFSIGFQYDGLVRHRRHPLRVLLQGRSGEAAFHPGGQQLDRVESRFGLLAYRTATDTSYITVAYIK
jgi:hypothetical protein